MKDAIGGGLLLNLVLIFVSIIILVFASILTYSKAFKVKNKIIEVIERNEKFDTLVVSSQIKEELTTAGYIIATKDEIKSKCDSGNLNEKDFLYCVYKKNVNNGYVYQVVTYTQFNIPIVGGLFTLPVKGETKILGSIYDY